MTPAAFAQGVLGLEDEEDEAEGEEDVSRLLPLKGPWEVFSRFAVAPDKSARSGVSSGRACLDILAGIK